MRLFSNFSAVLLASVSLGLLNGCGEAQSQAQPAYAPAHVDVITLEAQDVIFKQTLPARSVAYKEAEIRPQVSGIITKRLFEEGSLVKAGQALYQIDPAVYQANLMSAEAELAVAKANFHQAENDLTRYKQLIKQKLVSQQDLDKIQAQYDTYAAQLGVVEAAVYRAKVDISYTKVLAPIDGRISKSNVTEGALVTAQQEAALASITQLDPIYFDLPMANADLRKIRQRIASGELQEVDSNAELIFSDGEVYSLHGKLKFNEVQTNPSTDTVSLRVEFSNPDYVLLPGMYAKVQLAQGKRDNSILLPQKAVMYDHQSKPFVYVVDAEQKIEMRPITIDRAFDDHWLVTEGLSAGDTVVVTGVQKVSVGKPVVANPVSAAKAG